MQPEDNVGIGGKAELSKPCKTAVKLLEAGKAVELLEEGELCAEMADTIALTVLLNSPNARLEKENNSESNGENSALLKCLTDQDLSTKLNAEAMSGCTKPRSGG